MKCEKSDLVIEVLGVLCHRVWATTESNGLGKSQDGKFASEIDNIYMPWGKEEGMKIKERQKGAEKEGLKGV